MCCYYHCCTGTSFGSAHTATRRWVRVFREKALAVPGGGTVFWLLQDETSLYHEVLIVNPYHHDSSVFQANSIEGCKRKDVNVVYTRWQNLEKKPSYEAGQVRRQRCALSPGSGAVRV